MDASTAKTTPSVMGMGRPSDETIGETEDESNLKNLVAPSDFGTLKRNRGRSGHILENWLEDEVEFLHPLHVSLSESSSALIIRADVPGIKEKDLKINVEPNRVTITKTPATKKRSRTIYSASYSDETIRVIDLPDAVTVNKVTIAMRDGVLGWTWRRSSRLTLKGLKQRRRSRRVCR